MIYLFIISSQSPPLSDYKISIFSRRGPKEEDCGEFNKNVQYTFLLVRS